MFVYISSLGLQNTYTKIDKMRHTCMVVYPLLLLVGVYGTYTNDARKITKVAICMHEKANRSSIIMYSIYEKNSYLYPNGNSFIFWSLVDGPGPGVRREYIHQSTTRVLLQVRRCGGSCSVTGGDSRSEEMGRRCGSGNGAAEDDKSSLAVSPWQPAPSISSSPSAISRCRFLGSIWFLKARKTRHCALICLSCRCSVTAAAPAGRVDDEGSISAQPARCC